MRYEEFEDAFSSDRMNKYVTACNGDTRRSMMLYQSPNLQNQNKKSHKSTQKTKIHRKIFARFGYYA